jgi:hypothetical protein
VKSPWTVRERPFNLIIIPPFKLNGQSLSAIKLVVFKKKKIKGYWNSNFIIYKKSLKIPKGQSESVYRRRTDNTMAKRKSTKGQTTIYKTYI